ncbi:hypothetical protein QWY84_05460 [Aquisalimonas lutea]|uniref:hypothetical protein n=1 Tax=Aquisalimonas lutea TaxID=1327750 RepID=UPI0025B4BA0B|nr:hypothetical protein [Aquisalimonas lutea]MDN3517051.1 hypothetical protein [Aquisalimonas lutea]
MYNKAVRFLTVGLFSLIAVSLFLLSFALISTALTEGARDVMAGEVQVYGLLNHVSAIVISAAVLDLGKFIVEEEIIRGHDLRSTREVRASLTKFMTIILIAISLESLVMIFKVATGDQFAEILYPTLLMATTVFALVAIGLFQMLTRRAEEPTQDEKPAPTEP